MLPSAFQIVPFLFCLIVLPIILARRKRGVSTWFPAQITAFFALVAGIVLNQTGLSGTLGAQTPLVPPTLAILLAMALCAAFLPGR